MRPVLARIATLDEVRKKWTLYDLIDCHEMLDIQAEAEENEYKRAKGK